MTANFLGSLSSICFFLSSVEMMASREACHHFLVNFSSVEDDLVVSWFFSSNGKDDDELGGFRLVVIS
jgi:hypothetical protein